jgi:hypothetical protein
MNERSFSERNLRELFGLISKRFPDPIVLRIHVATSVEQLSTPEEADQGWNSSEKVNDVAEKHFWAFYLRSDDDEFFRYSPVEDKTDVRTVQLGKPKKSPKVG